MNGAEINGWVGNLTRDPELAFGASGKAVTRFALAVNRRTGVGESASTEPFFIDCKAFGALGEHIAYTCAKGQRVIISGRMVRESWEDSQGKPQRRTVCYVNDAGPSLLFATASVERVERGAESNNGNHHHDAVSDRPPSRPAPAPAPTPAAVGALDDELDF